MDKMSVAEAVKHLQERINQNSELEVEYIEMVDASTLKPVEKWSDAQEIQLWCAVYARPVRLIDNVKVK
jgi:pantothenate synthetase